METDLIRAVQSRLHELGWYVGLIDGDAGSLTETALTDFKRASGLNPRAYVGPITLMRLFSPSALVKPRPKPSATKPAWFVEAERLKGTKETAGKGSNKVILDWADKLDIAYTGDDIAWCGLFTAHCMKTGAPADPSPKGALSARSWLTYGREVKPQLGAILVFWRGSKAGWQGHVGFYAGEDATTFSVLGGNQSDAVSVARISKDRLLGARWPKSIDAPGTVVSATGGALSTNEA